MSNTKIKNKDYEVVSDFIEGFAKVKRKTDDKYNFIDKDGKYLSKEWFDKCWHFNVGFSRINFHSKGLVKKDGKWDILTNEGDLLSPEGGISTATALKEIVLLPFFVLKRMVEKLFR